MKALIITYYWPPAGGSGVQRWLYFVKYLRDFGIEPVLFIPENAAYPILDKELLDEVPKNLEIHRVNILEPMRFLSKKNKKTTAGFLPEKKSWKNNWLTYIRANYFIPDARKFWINPVSRKVLKYLDNNRVDWIITTGPPHSVHLIGKEVKEQSPIKWLADFRDPWTSIDYFHHLPLTKQNLQKHKSLEKQVLENADIVTVVSEQMKQEFEAYNAHTYCITNGFDGAVNERKPSYDDGFQITHMGSVNADRNPKVLWQALQELIVENVALRKAIKINLTGHIADEVLLDIEGHHLTDYCHIRSYIPHQEVMEILHESHLLLLLINQVPNAKGIVTGKVFEYLQVKRPILALAPTDGDLTKIIDKTQSGKVVEFNDKERLKRTILEYFDDFQRNNMSINSHNIEIYHRKNLTAKLVDLLKKNT